MSDTTDYQKTWYLIDVILNRGKHYYENDKRLRKQARNKYINLSEEDKNWKREYKRSRYNNMPEKDKQKL